jgi:hypothetical protein
VLQLVAALGMLESGNHEPPGSGCSRPNGVHATRWPKCDGCSNYSTSTARRSPRNRG